MGPARCDVWGGGRFRVVGVPRSGEPNLGLQIFLGLVTKTKNVRAGDHLESHTLLEPLQHVSELALPSGFHASVLFKVCSS